LSDMRVGSGFDAHRLASGRALMLGGVRIEFKRGLIGHSDGDCVIHALCDALLGAAAAGDMGEHFPSSDERFRGANSLEFLREVRRMIAKRGYIVENVDVTAIAQEPRLAPHLAAMRAVLSRTLAVDPERVSVKAKSTDGLGAVGRAEGIAALASALLRRSKRRAVAEGARRARSAKRRVKRRVRGAR
jgi:2-C-methyl-D-erythritol 2,4-cyclodiphosphate synthase